MIFLLLHYLVKGGLLHISTSLGEHFDQLSTVLKGQMHHKEEICILLKILLCIRLLNIQIAENKIEKNYISEF